mgnify:CR=1 FL=1
MSTVERKLGLTPVIKRLAFYYLKKGVGSHAIESPFYDEIIVRELYDWHTPNDKMPPRGGIVVEFMWLGERVRFVEFGCSYIGGGGREVMRQV